MADEMDRYANMKQREVTLLLLHIHDNLWLDRHLSLKARIEGCKEIQKILREFHLKPIQ